MNLRKVVCLLFSYILLYTSMANAKDISRLTFHEISSRGIKNGCSLNFQVIGRDEAYKTGTQIISWGSFLSYYKDETMGNMFKIGVSDWLKSLDYIQSNKVSLLKSDKINYAYFKTKHCTISKEVIDNTNKILGQNNNCASSSNQEIKISYGEKDEFLAIYDWTNFAFRNINKFGGNIEIGFNRKDSGMDVKLILDLTMKENLKEIIKYSECYRNITDAFLFNLENNLNKNKKKGP